MARYRLVFKKSVVKDFKGIPENQAAEIIARIEGLARDPRTHGSIKLAGQESYRLRQGMYRILYRIDDNELLITIVKVAHRQGA